MNEPEVPGQDEDLYVWDESDLGPTALDTERGRAELISELNGLRSRIQILRAERTAMAGKKYALEVMLEGTQTKVLEMDELLRTSGDPPAAQLAQLAELVHQAKLVAEGRGSSKDGLEAERLAQLEAMNVLEGRLADLKERAAGYRSERDALRGQVGAVEREHRAREEQLMAKLQSFSERGKQAIAARDAALQAQREAEAALTAAEERAAEARAEFEALAAQASAEDRARAERLQEVLSQAAQDATLLERAANALRSRAGGLREVLAAVEQPEG
ncbi:MAG: hypothetical protein KDD82_27945 [Planctomycetes bacterium]|nr:hypothetical protein [Planctomycetota bacterium]